MKSVQQREQSSDAATESGFFEKRHARAAGTASGAELANGAAHGAVCRDAASLDAAAPDAAAWEAISPDPTTQSSMASGAVAHGAGLDDAVLHAFGEVRSLNAELQRANDALHGANEVLRGKMDQLRTTALDLEQMLDGVELGVLLLDDELAVRHFNGMAAHFLGLGNHDVGGSISASCRGFGPRLVEWCREVLRTGRRLRRTFQSAIGEPLTLHVRRTRVDGESRLILVFTETA